MDGNLIEHQKLKTMEGTKQAIVLKIEDRFYRSHNDKRIVTAWCLAGAFLFLESSNQHFGGSLITISQVEEILKKKGYKPVRKIVQLVE